MSNRNFAQKKKDEINTQNNLQKVSFFFMTFSEL